MDQTPRGATSASRATDPAYAGAHRAPDRSRRSTARRAGTAGLAAAVTLGLLPALALSPGANAAVTVGQNVSVFPDRDMVVAVGYNPGEQMTVEVLRNGTLIGRTVGAAASTPEGVGLEVNHGPPGPQARPGDCWVDVTPDILGGDEIRVSVTRAGVVLTDSMTVTPLEITVPPALDEQGNVVVYGKTGASRLGADAFSVELRFDDAVPERFRRGPFEPSYVSTDPSDTTWKASFRPDPNDPLFTVEQQRAMAINDASWLAVTPGVTQTTLAELGEAAGPAPGCEAAPAEPNAVVSGYQAPINLASGDLVLTGTARPGVAAVTVTVGSLAPVTATPVPHATNTEAPQTWTVTVPRADLDALPDGAVTVRSAFDGLAGTARSIAKDTVAPAAPTATPAAGTYSGTQAVTLNRAAGEPASSTIRYEIGQGTVADPSATSRAATGQIEVTATQTITARVFDAAGNPGDVATFAYKIGTPPAAPTGVTVTETADGVRVTWPAVTGAASYDVYRDGGTAPVNSAPVTGTSFSDTGVADGSHTYVVRAVSTDGIDSAPSSPASVAVGAPGVPADVRAVAGNASVSVSWTGVADTDVASYEVTRQGAEPVLVSATQTTHLDTGVTNGTTYTYSVVAVDKAGKRSAASPVVQATPAPPPDTTKPIVSGRTPVSGAADVATGTTVQAVFSEDVLGVDATTFLLKQGTTAVPATVAYDAASRTATLTPSAALAAGTTYTVEATAGITDRALNTLTPVTWTFATAAPAPAPAPAPTTPTTRTVTIDALEDTKVYQASPATAYGNDVTLNTDSNSPDTNATSRVTSYLKFRVPALAAGESITGASLSLNVTEPTGNGPTVHRVQNGWAEGTLTWNSTDPARIAIAGNYGSMALGRRALTVSGITTAGDHSFELFADGTDGVTFSSSENTTVANRPQLVLTVSSSGGTTTPPPPPPADTTPPAAPSVTPASGSYSGTQSMTVTGEAGATLRYTVGTGTTVPADPTATTGTVYSGPVAVSSSSVVKVIAVDGSGNASPVTRRDYTITTAPAPTPPPPTGGGTTTTRTVVLGAVADTMVRQDTPTTAYGSDPLLRLDSQFGGTNSRINSYVKFEVPTLAAGETISSARLMMRFPNATDNGPAVFRTQTGWTEAGLTWNGVASSAARISPSAVGNFGALSASTSTRQTTAVSGVTAGVNSFELYAESNDGTEATSRQGSTTWLPQLEVVITKTS